MTVPRNNPGNIRFLFSIKWKGQVGQDGGFCVFDTLQDGARALCIDLLNAQEIHQLESVAEIIPHYAPPNENNTAAYIAAVCKDMSVRRGRSVGPGQRRDAALVRGRGMSITNRVEAPDPGHSRPSGGHGFETVKGPQ